MSTNWEKNPNYPMTFAVCKECGSEGLMKLAWDQHGYLCVDAKPCLARLSQKYKKTEVSSEELVEDVFVEEAEASADLVDFFERPKPVVSLPDPDPGNQIYQCGACNVIWQRPATRGRPPKVCPDCR